MKQHKALKLSFEFFPPRTPKMAENLWRALRALESLKPIFVSVTYGAGGSLRENTHASVLRILRETALDPAAHLTCVGEERASLEETLRSYWSAGVRRIVALRGDMPDNAAYQHHPRGFASTPDFIRAICAAHAFEVSVSAYPETHPDSPSAEKDLDLLKRKIDAGATRAITQFCFETDAHVRYLERVRAAGITIPIAPGIIPTTNFTGIARMAVRCGASVPRWLCETYEGLEDNPSERLRRATDIALRQARDLRAAGFDHLHFYTLNQAGVTRAVCESLESA